MNSMMILVAYRQGSMIEKNKENLLFMQQKKVSKMQTHTKPTKSLNGIKFKQCE